MATTVLETHSDSDSDYGYDLSLEDEQILAALASQIPVHPPATAPISGAAPRVGLSSVSVSLRSWLSPVAPAPSALEDDIDSAFGGRDSSTDFEISRNDPLDAVSLDPGSVYSHVPSFLNGRPGGKAALASIDAAYEADQVSFRRAAALASPPIVTAIPSSDITYPDLTGALSQLAPEPSRQPMSPAEMQSPLERFRTYPNKPLSVTDLTSGAWCELQYEYTLTRLPGGKKTRTRAMKEGTKVHKKLEDQVHTTVEVNVSSKEDLFGLRIWNVIQGLRTLRDTGLTREIEVWGIINGNVVNGLIDGLTYRNPDPDFEEEYMSSQDSQRSGKQKKIDDFLPKQPVTGARNGSTRKIYLVDVKTRGSKTLPSGAAVRPTKVQLFLYHRFLSDMACGELDYHFVFRRYGLDVDKPFSDQFIAQIGSLHHEIFIDAMSTVSSSPSSRSSRSSSSRAMSGMRDLIRYRSLSELIKLLISELRLTFPNGEDSIGPLVTAEYRSRPPPTPPSRDKKEEDEDGEGRGDKESADEGGAVVGQNVFPVDDNSLNQFLAENMQWWNGKRKAHGVDIEEAFKCRTCEFAELCTWRKEMDEENLRKVRERLAAREKGGDPSGGKRSRRAMT
ncbi:Exonuclease V [Pleurostoma richardsiae]|uniref:Exonuclease V n=1 Tax=Pleurostoma richardsiae TaxID=41990 RepID=A0AA38VCE7_9PEZI|nr:Exonuclease V [Pleurostoma richardsiae]